MEREICVDRDDCTIVREHPDNMDYAVLFDSNGDIVFRVPKSWTDNQIWAALYIGNGMYSAGFQAGMDRKMEQIREVIGVV